MGIGCAAAGEFHVEQHRAGGWLRYLELFDAECSERFVQDNRATGLHDADSTRSRRGGTVGRGRPSPQAPTDHSSGRLNQVTPAVWTGRNGISPTVAGFAPGTGMNGMETRRLKTYVSATDHSHIQG